MSVSVRAGVGKDDDGAQKGSDSAQKRQCGAQSARATSSRGLDCAEDGPEVEGWTV